MLYATTLRDERIADTAAIAHLEPGETFEVLDVVGAIAWGVAVAHGLVGYVDAAALGMKADEDDA